MYEIESKNVYSSILQTIAGTNQFLWNSRRAGDPLIKTNDIPVDKKLFFGHSHHRCIVQKVGRFA